MRVLIRCFACLLLAVGLKAEKWEAAVDANLSVTQNAYSDSWQGGEAGSVSWNSNFNAMAQKPLHAKVHNKNTLKVGFGQTHTQNSRSRDWLSPVKSTDLADFESVLRFTLGAFVDPFAGGRAETQFFDARDAGHTTVVNPLTITESIGVARVIVKKVKTEWTARAGAGLRQHVDRNVYDTTGSVYTTSVTKDGGLEFVTEFKSPLAGEKISYNTKLVAFQALYNSKSEEILGLPIEDFWKMPDVNWEHFFSAAIAKYLMINLNVQLLYDKEIDKRVRWKQVLSLSLTYKLL